METRTVLGRPARLITAMQASGKGTVELWIEDGPWVYEIHGYHRDLQALLEMAESMK